MDFIEKTGKTVEDALNDALKELKTTADKVNVEVIEEAKNGIFGLFAKKAKIRVTLKDAAKKSAILLMKPLTALKKIIKPARKKPLLQGKLLKKKNLNRQYAKRVSM